MEKLIDIARQRHSCRAFTLQPIDPATLGELAHYMLEHRTGLEGAAVDFQVIQKTGTTVKKMRVNYGAVKNHHTYVAGKTGTSVRARVNYGFLLERIALEATALGLASCWIGYFDPEYFTEIALAEGEAIPSILVIGYDGPRTGLAGRLLHHIAHAGERQDWAALFFNGDFTRPLSREDAGAAACCLDALRLAPSSGNTQPWRIVMTDGGKRFHFYKLPLKPAYEKRGLHDVDLGIAMAHFDLAARETGLKGEWTLPAAPTIKPAEGMVYIATWVSA